MRTATSVTYVDDNYETAAEELVSKIRLKLPESNKNFGILICDSDIDVVSLVAATEAFAGFPVIGCTSIGILSEDGFSDMSACLFVISGGSGADAEDFYISLETTNSISPENVRDELEAAYKRGEAALHEVLPDNEIKVVFTLTSYVNDLLYVNVYSDILSSVSGGKPVFGGFPTASDNNNSGIIFNNEFYNDRAFLLLISGNVKPVFSVKSSAKIMSASKKVVTKAKDNVVYTVGDKTFLEYTESIGLPVENGEIQANSYMASPFLAEPSCNEGTFSAPIYSVLRDVDFNEQSGIFYSSIPQDSFISITVMRRQDIESSVRECVDELLEKIKENEKDGYEYSTVFCISCFARYLTLSPDNGLEGEVLVEKLPSCFSLGGFYSGGEICPSYYDDKTGYINGAHNTSITLLAL